MTLSSQYALKNGGIQLDAIVVDALPVKDVNLITEIYFIEDISLHGKQSE